MLFVLIDFHYIKISWYYEMQLVIFSKNDARIRFLVFHSSLALFTLRRLSCRVGFLCRAGPAPTLERAMPSGPAPHRQAEPGTEQTNEPKKDNKAKCNIYKMNAGYFIFSHTPIRT